MIGNKKWTIKTSAISGDQGALRVLAMALLASRWSRVTALETPARSWQVSMKPLQKNELMAPKMCFISDKIFDMYVFYFALSQGWKIPQMIYRLKLVFVCFGTVCCVLYAG